MGPYTKVEAGEAWDILDGAEDAIATLQTETLANYMLAALLGVYPSPPDYPADEPLGEEEAKDDSVLDPYKEWRKSGMIFED